MLGSNQAATARGNGGETRAPAVEPDPRSRFVYNDQQRCVLLINYKCGFTSLSRATAGLDEWKHDLRQPSVVAEAVANGRFDGYDFHVVARNPCDRIISFYWDWLVRKEADFTDVRNKGNIHFERLREVLSPTDYEQFAATAASSRGTAEYFDRYFVPHLGALYDQDQHLWPQHWVYSHVGLTRQQVAVHEISELDGLFSAVDLPPIPPANVAHGLRHAEFHTPDLNRAVPAIYGRDFVELGYEVPLTAPAPSPDEVRRRNRPRVSVICPVKDGVAHVRGAIDSVLNQTYEDVDVLVIDGGSTDGTIDVLREFGDRIRWVSEPDTGQSSAINRGFDMADGDVLGWLNADDELLPEAIDAVVEAFRSGDADLVYGDAIAEDGRGRRYGLRTNVGTGTRHDLVYDRCFVVQPGSFYRRALWEKVGPLRTDMHFAFDYEFLMRAAAHHRFERLNVPLAIERHHAGAKTSTGRRARIEEIKLAAAVNGGDTLPRAFQPEGAAVLALDAASALRAGNVAKARADLRQARRWATPLPRTVAHVLASAPMKGRLLSRARLVHNGVVHATRQRSAANIGRRAMVRAYHRHGPSLGNLNQYAPKVMHHTPPRVKAPAAFPSITLVTPSYNQGEFLGRTIDSVLAQDYPNLEYRVQDGGSTDETTAVLESVDSTLVAWESAPDEGQANAINVGHASGTGEIMGWLNSDDVLLPGHLRAVGAHFAANPHVDVVYAHRILIDDDDMEIGRWMVPRHDARALEWADYVPQETLFWRRTLWDRVGGLDESFRFALDWDLLLRFQAAGATFARLPHFGGGFRVHQAQLTSSVLDSTGSEEMARLRRRCHGRDVNQGEIIRALAPYLARHVVLRTAWQAGLVRQ